MPTSQKPGNPGSSMRHRVTLQQPVLTPDGEGGFTRAWSDVATLWAQIEPVAMRSGVGGGTGVRKFTDQRLEPITTHRITLRYWPNVTADMRLMYGTRIFAILSVINPDERNITLQILAKEGIGG